MTNRPAIPAEISRQVLFESGHRCAVCGTGTPLERAHITPWHKSKEHNVEDLICLCANCHQRSHSEKWTDKTLRMYKEKPWVMRQHQNMDIQPKPTTKVKLQIDMNMADFDKRSQLWLKHALSSFLGVLPDDVLIQCIEEGSVRATIELPVHSAEYLLKAYRENDPELAEYLHPLTLLNVLRQTEWYSLENLERAWKYARLDIRDDFVFDIINYADIRENINLVLSSLHAQLKNDQYYPSPLIRIGVPKNYHSVRPGTVISIIDLIVLYAIAQQLVPLLDHLLCDSAYAYRLNPKAIENNQPLFKVKDESDSEEQEANTMAPHADEEAENEVDLAFPYNWFFNWKLFHDSSQQASKEYRYAAVTDITAYFENISLDLLREILKEKLNSEQRELVDRLFRLLEFWNWTPSGNLPGGVGLPQGNDVSSFLSNLYLMDLDNAMLRTVKGDSSKYYRYVDDVRLFTSDEDEAIYALVELERVLRTLNLNVQSAKTKIVPANQIHNPEIESWLNKMSDDEIDKLDHAINFFESESWRVLKGEDTHWQRPYLRCLTILRNANDDRAVKTALDLFLDNPSNKLLIKNFLYLRHFVSTHTYGDAVVARLSERSFTFPYHRGFMYRLAAYSRDDLNDLKCMALEESINSCSHWFCRIAALFCLSTFPLDGKELARISKILKTEAMPQITRAAFVTLCQHSGRELEVVLDRLSFFNAPYQEYLQRYFSRLYKPTSASQNALFRIKGSSVNAPIFIHNLHKLDLLKAATDRQRRRDFKEIIELKIRDCQSRDWPRLMVRLEQLRDFFITG